jgi:xanthine/uracil/vitamin C permease (AzgA family)
MAFTGVLTATVLICFTMWGFISHVGLYLMVGRRREIHPVMYALALISMIAFLERVKFG